jgi:hypothetical protein
MTRPAQSPRYGSGVPSSGMPFYTARDGRSSICMDCFLTVIPKDGQTLIEEQRDHECRVSKHDPDERDEHGNKRPKNCL